MTASKSGTTFLIDFDGTLCDSIADTTQAAISAANILWPAEMQVALSLNPRDAGVRKSWVGGNWSEYDNDRRISDNIPRWLEEKMRQLRPVVSRGSDAVLAARLIVSEAVNSKSSSLGERPLSVGEIVENWDVLRESMLFRVKYRPAQLDESFDKQRTDRRIPIEVWAKRNPMYSGIASSLCGSTAPFYIITRRDAKFTHDVLESAGISVPSDRIICVKPGRKKVDALVEIASAVGTSDGEAHLVYIDDNVNVVREVVGDLRLAGKLRVCFAEWGYSSAGQKAMARAFPRVMNINPQQFADLVNGRGGKMSA